MFNSKSTKVVSLLAITAVALAACGKDDEATTSSAAVSASSDLLQYIPADSPYVFVSLEPVSDDIMDNLEPKLDRVLSAYQDVVTEVVTAKLDELDEEERDSAEAQQVDQQVDRRCGPSAARRPVLPALPATDGITAAAGSRIDGKPGSTRARSRPAKESGRRCR